MKYYKLICEDSHDGPFTMHEFKTKARAEEVRDWLTQRNFEAAKFNRRSQDEIERLKQGRVYYIEEAVITDTCDKFEAVEFTNDWYSYGWKWKK